MERTTKSSVEVPVDAAIAAAITAASSKSSCWEIASSTAGGTKAAGCQISL